METNNSSSNPKKITLIFNLIFSVMLIFIGITGLFFKPLQTAYSVSWAFGLILIFTGVSVFFSSFAIKKAGIDKWWLVLLQGICATILGGYLIAYPLYETAVIVIIYGVYLISASIIRIIATREHWGFTLLQFILGILIVSSPGVFLVWAYLTIFMLFIINGVYSSYMSIKLLRK